MKVFNILPCLLICSILSGFQANAAAPETVQIVRAAFESGTKPAESIDWSGKYQCREFRAYDHGGDDVGPAYVDESLELTKAQNGYQLQSLVLSYQNQELVYQKQSGCVTSNLAARTAGPNVLILETSARARGCAILPLYWYYWNDSAIAEWKGSVPDHYTYCVKP